MTINAMFVFIVYSKKYPFNMLIGIVGVRTVARPPLVPIVSKYA